jgi:Fe-S oxidoreductase
LRPIALDALRGIVGTTNVLTDIEDLYVYSFERIFREPYLPNIKVVIRTTSSKKIEEVMKLADEEGFLLALRERTVDSSAHAKPVMLLDDSKLPNLQPYEKPEAATEDLSEFSKTEIGNLKKLAFAQKLLFIGKPTNKCLECNTCSSYCTVASSFNGVETWSAKGRMLLIRGVANEELPISQKIIDIIYTCSNCGLCFAECLQLSELRKAIQAALRQIALKNSAPKIFKTAATNILKVGDPSGALSQKSRSSWLKTVSNPSSKKKAEVLYWVGCTVATRTPRTAKAVATLLNRTGVDYALLGQKEGCCGYVLMASGLWNEAKENAVELVEKIGKTEARQMVTSCAGCYYMFSELFSEKLDVEMPCEVLHASQFMEDLIQKRQLDFEGFEAKVAYHDPCSLGRHTNVYDAPRNVLTRWWRTLVIQ